METVNEKNKAKDYDDFFDVKPTTRKAPESLPKTSVMKKTIEKIEKPQSKTPWTKNKQNLNLDEIIPAKPKEQLATIIPPVTRRISQGSSESLVICAWNINGLRPVTEKGFLQDYIKQRQPDILCLGETKSSQESIDNQKLTDWVPYYYPYRYWNCSKIRKGCYGTGIITKNKPLSVEYGIGLERFDVDGRSITLEYEKFYIVNCYVPNSSDDFCHLPERVREWDPAFRTYLTKLKAKKPVILCGDLNIIHRVIDLAIISELGKVAGSSEEEKSNFNSLLKTGFVDTYRSFYPQKQKYTWFNFKRPKQRGEGKGRRYDYVLVSDEILKNVTQAFIDDHVYGSDHCPVGIIFNQNFSNDDPTGSLIKTDPINEEKSENLDGIKTPPIDEMGKIISDDIICIDSD